MENIMIFLQGKLNNDDSWEVFCFSNAHDVAFMPYNKKGRISIAKREGVKFGFVLKSLKK